MRYVIIGGGIAGVTAAKTIHQHDPAGDIRVLSFEYHPLGLYARKDMARRLAEGETTEDDLLIETPAQLAQQGIKFEYREVLRVFPRLGQIMLPHHIRKEYDRLLLALGATPRLVDAPGLHYIGVHQVRSYEDISFIEGWMHELRARGAVIVGGGILGLDMAYALKRRGVPVTLITREGIVGAPLLPKAAGHMIEQRMHGAGINVITGRTVSAYLSDDDRVLDAVRLDDGQIIPTRMALCAVGVRPSTDLLEESGIELDNHSGAIVVNDYLETSVPGIYAAGNCAQAGSVIARNWRMSAEQGRIAGLNMVGEQTIYQPGLIGDLDTQIYDLPLAYFGPAQPASDVRIWIHQDTEQFAQVLLSNGRVIGATLLGAAASAGPALAGMSRSGAHIDDLHALFGGVPV